jgi:hypothetical protein
MHRPDAMEAPRRLAVFGAWAAAAMTAAFLVALLVTPLMAPLPTEWRGSEAYAAGFVPWTMLAIAASLLLVPFVLVMKVGIHHLTPPDRRWASHLALVFGAIYAAIIAANDYMQLITVRGRARCPDEIPGEPPGNDHILPHGLVTFLTASQPMLVSWLHR